MQNLTGNIIEIDVEKTDTVQKLKEYVEEKAGIPPKQQRLIFGGKAMYVKHPSCKRPSLPIFQSHPHFVHLLSRADEKTVESYKIQAGAVLHLVLALRGGN